MKTLLRFHDIPTFKCVFFSNVRVCKGCVRGLGSRDEQMSIVDVQEIASYAFHASFFIC